MVVRGHTMPALSAPTSLPRPAAFEPASPLGAETQSRMAGCCLASGQRSLPALELCVLGCGAGLCRGILGAFLPGLGHLSSLQAQLLPWQGHPREPPEEVSLCCGSRHHP